MSFELPGIFGDASFSFGGAPWRFPGLLFWWSVALFVATLLLAIQLGWVTNTLTRRLTKLRKALEGTRQTGQSMSRRVFDQVAQLLGQDDLTRGGWGEFEETVLREERGTEGEVAVFNTRQASEFFPHSLVDQRILPAHRIWPTTLTALGLLGTFLALLIGLHGVRVNETPPAVSEAPAAQEETSEAVLRHQTPQQTVEGIGDLINSLSGKFVSSIVALFLAACFAMFEGARIRSATKALDGFCSAFDALFVRRTPEYLLQRIHEQIESQSSAFRHFNTDLSGYLRQSFQESLGPTLERLTNTLERMTGTSEERLAELVRSLSETFRSNLTDSARTEFQALADSVGGAARLLEQMKEGNVGLQEGLTRLLSQLEESRRQQSEAMVTHQRTMDDVLAQVSGHVRGVATESNATLESTVTRLLERTAEWTQATSAGVTGALERYVQVFEERTATLLERLDAIVGRLATSTETGTAQLAAAVGDVAARLQEATAQAVGSLQEATTGVVQHTGDASERLYGQVHKLLDQQEAQAATLLSARKELDEAVTQVRSLMGETQAAFGAARAVSGDFVSASRDLRASAEAVRGAHGPLEEVARRLTECGASVARSGEEHRRLLGEHLQVFDRVKVSLAQVLKQVDDAMRHYHEASRTSLRENLEEFDRHLATAIQHIKDGVEGVGEGLEDLEAALDSAAKRIGKDGRQG